MSEVSKGSRKAVVPALLLLLAGGWQLPDPAAATTKGIAELPAGPEIEDADLLALTPQMAKFLVEQVGPSRARTVRLRNLVDAIFSKEGLGIKYGNTRTKTAQETFEERSGNCLSFTFLFVAMARHLGLVAYFQEVAEVLSWDQRGEVVVSNKHMFAEVEIDNGIVQVDFLPGVEKRYHAVHRISDQRALAHYYNNVGAEKLADGHRDEALRYFDKALATDDALAPAWVNHGFAHRQQGRFDVAEASYLKALELDAGELSAASNLASLYLLQGRRAEAAPYLRRVESHQQRNPFHHFRLGLRTAENGDLEAAVRHFKEAARRAPNDAGFHVTLADTYERVGDVENARESFQRALRLSGDDEQKKELRARLEALGGT